MRRIGFFLGIPPDLRKDFAVVMRGLHGAFLESDADLAEINPLVVTDGGRLLALDAKVVLDDSALPRHPDLEEMRDLNEEEPSEIAARAAGISFIKLDGDIGCMVNGAGLAMTTMDLVKLAGGEPANFLDIGGGAKADRVVAAFRIILDDPHVKAILINIFGGITRGDEVAQGIVEARGSLTREVPMVVRIVGTNAEEARPILAEANLITADSLDDAAAKAVEAAVAPVPRGVSVLVDRETRLLVQGITGREGEFHSTAMLEYGTNIVAGVTPGKGGQTALDGRVRSSTQWPMRWRRPGRTPPASSSPPPSPPMRCSRRRTRRHPARDLHHRGRPRPRYADRVPRAEGKGGQADRPELPRPDVGGEAKVGIIPGTIHARGPVGLVSRSGTLTYEVVQAMTDAGMDQTTCLGIGGDPIIGTSFIDALDLFNQDPETEAIVMIGEIGGEEEERAAAFVARRCVSQWRHSSPAGPPHRAAAWARRRDHLDDGWRHRRVEALRPPRRPVSGSPTRRRTFPGCSARPGSADP